MILTDKEIVTIDQQLKTTLQNILKLPSKSSASLVYFVAGSLPGSAVLHLKQLTLFGMICRLPGDPLNILARQMLTTSSSTSSWFIRIRNLCLEYNLPHPLLLLDKPPTKEAFKKQIKAKVLDVWEQKLRAQASLLPSLMFFKPQFMSLACPHTLLLIAGQKPYEVAKARIQLLFLSSQYPCAKYSRHWTPDNPMGLCTYQQCKEHHIVESIDHVLLFCPAYGPMYPDRLLIICI